MMICLITVTLALVLGSEGADHSDYSFPPPHNLEACKENNDSKAYNKFVQKHILQEDFNRKLKKEWQAYIEKKKLCNRPLQSFFEKTQEERLNKICNDFGRPLTGHHDNLCISNFTMTFYEVYVNTTSCEILTSNNNLKKSSKVIVACDKVGNCCCPVHFERYTNQRANNNAKPCKPSGLN